MILIADSGSTKTEWVLLEESGSSKAFRTIGLNPYYIDEIDIKHTITVNLLRNFERESVHELFFYGSGCGADDKKKLLENILSELFSKAEIHVFTDILGTARALFGKSEGIACILGTGSNSCLYDGNEIMSIVPSRGFIFGDEGSGSCLGKELLSHYFKNTLPDTIKNAFIKKYNLPDTDIMDAIYRRPFPNRFLGSFSQFINEHLNDRFIKKMVEDSFNKFLDYYIRQYKNYKKYDIGITGSVAFYFRKQLEEVFKKNSLELTTLLKSPIDNLVKYHLQKVQSSEV
jgi:glucosamine kinase